MQLNGLKQKLTATLPTFVFVLFVLQPVMDVLSFWMARMGMGNSLTLALRMGVLAVTVVAAFSVSRNKRAYYVMAGVLGLLAAGHIFACIQAGYQSPFTDIANFIRVVQMPITALCLISMCRANDRCYDTMKYGFLTCLVIIFAVEVLAVLTGTDPHTYPDGRGTIGWFQNTNSQSCILTMLPPVALTLLLQRKGMKHWSFWLVLVGSMLALYFLGPRLSYMGMVGIGLGLAVSILIVDIKKWRQSLVLAAAVAVFLAFMNQSPMMVHQLSYESVQGDRQESIDKIVAQAELPKLDQEQPLSEEELEARKQAWRKTLIPIYETYASDFVELFGVEKTMEIYDYAYNVKDITATRYKKIQFAKLLMNDSPASARVFGLELGRFTVNGEIYDVENDFHGIYFLYGIVGLGMMLAFLAYFLWLIVWALWKNWRQYFTLDAAAWGIALIMCLVHAYFTAAILRRPNASFYMSAILAAVYYLVKVKRYPEASQENKE